MGEALAKNALEVVEWLVWTTTNAVMPIAKLVCDTLENDIGGELSKSINQTSMDLVHLYCNAGVSISKYAIERLGAATGGLDFA